MKKITFFAAVSLLAMVCLSSCGKRCWCYQAVNGTMTESEVYTDEYERCNTLSNLTRTCVEDGERMDPSQIAYKR